MSATLLLTLGLVATAMLAMAVGVLIKGRCLSGSCGGTSARGCACKHGQEDHRADPPVVK